MTKLPTGIAELDLVLDGGFAPGSCVVLAGAPGTGKTILAQQICFANASPDHRSIYYTTLSEPHSKLVAHLEDFTFFDAEAVGQTVVFHHLAALAEPSGDVPMTAVATEVVRNAFESRPSVIVIDSSKALHEAEGTADGCASPSFADRITLPVGTHCGSVPRGSSCIRGSNRPLPSRQPWRSAGCRAASTGSIR